MTFLDEAAPGAGQERLHTSNVAEHGYVWNLTGASAYQPEAKEQLMALFPSTAETAGLTPRQRAAIVIAQAAAINDGYCAVAGGKRLTARADPQTTIAALNANEEPLSDREQALADWARTVTRGLDSRTPQDLKSLRDAGFKDPQFVALAIFAGIPTAFSSINSALGARPDISPLETLRPAV